MYAGSDYCGALVGPVVVLIGRDRPGAQLPEHGRRWIKLVNAEYPQGSGFMIVLRSEAPPPNDDTRVRVGQSLEECSRAAVAGAIVIEGEGFIAATLRAFFGAFALINYRFRLRIHASVREAALPLLKRIGRPEANEASEFALAVEELKTAYAAGSLVVPPSAPPRGA